MTNERLEILQRRTYGITHDEVRECAKELLELRAALSQAQQALRWISKQGQQQNNRCRVGKFVFERPLRPDPLCAPTIYESEADAWEHLAFWIHTHLWEIVSKAEAALPSDAPEAAK